MHVRYDGARKTEWRWMFRVVGREGHISLTRPKSIAVVSVSHVGLRICQATPRSICVSSSGHVRGIGKSERSRTVVRRVSASVEDRSLIRALVAIH